MVRGRTLLGLMLAAMVPWLVGAQEDDPILQQAAQGAIELGDTVVQLPAVYVTRVDISIANENLPGLEEIEVEEEVLVPEPTDEQAVPATNNVVSGAFTATNESDAVQSGLQYELVVVAAEQGYEVETISPDDPRVYYRVPPTGDISLGPGGSQIIAFEHEVPALPGDNYRVRIQLLTDDGRQLGWQDSVVVLEDHLMPL